MLKEYQNGINILQVSYVEQRDYGRCGHFLPQRDYGEKMAELHEFLPFCSARNSVNPRLKPGEDLFIIGAVFQRSRSTSGSWRVM